MKHSKHILTAVLSAAACIFLTGGDISRQAVCSGFKACAQSAVPALFPMLVLTKLWQQSRGSQGCSRAELWLVGSVSGYPAGAGAVAAAYKDGTLTKQQATAALGFCCNAGPAFLIGVAGHTVLGSAKAGLLLCIIHLFSSALIAGFFPAADCPPSHRQAGAHPPCSVMATQAILQAGQTMIQICTYLIFFSVLQAHLLRFLSPDSSNTVLHIGMNGILELTGGMHSLAASKLPWDGKLILCAAFSAWGGLCIHCQTAAILADTDLSMGSYLLGKAIHTGLSVLLASIILLWVRNPKITPLLLCFVCFCLAAAMLAKSFSGKTRPHRI